MKKMLIQLIIMFFLGGIAYGASYTTTNKPVKSSTKQKSKTNVLDLYKNSSKKSAKEESGDKKSATSSDSQGLWPGSKPLYSGDKEKKDEKEGEKKNVRTINLNSKTKDAKSKSKGSGLKFIK